MKDKLEQFIDQSGLDNLLRAIAEVCYEKSDHVNSNWGDEPLAKAWEKAGHSIDLLSAKAVVKNLP